MGQENSKLMYKAEIEELNAWCSSTIRSSVHGLRNQNGHRLIPSKVHTSESLTYTIDKATGDVTVGNRTSRDLKSVEVWISYEPHFAGTPTSVISPEHVIPPTDWAGIMGSTVLHAVGIDNTFFKEEGETSQILLYEEDLQNVGSLPKGAFELLKDEGKEYDVYLRLQPGKWLVHWSGVIYQEKKEHRSRVCLRVGAVQQERSVMGSFCTLFYVDLPEGFSEKARTLSFEVGCGDFGDSTIVLQKIM